LPRHHPVEPCQLVCRFLLHRRAQHGRQLVHLALQPFGNEDRSAELLQVRDVHLPEAGQIEDALEEQDAIGPRPRDAQVLPATGELPERVIEIPRDELELAGLRVQVDDEVLAHAEDAVRVAQPHGDGHEPGELVEVEVILDAGGKSFVGGMRHELCQRDHACRLLVRHRRFRVVDLLVRRPPVAEILERLVGDRLEQRSLPGAEAVAREGVVDVLDD
jgi:hypothetical protein